MGGENDKRAVDVALVGLIRSGQRNDTLVTIGIILLIIGVLVAIIMIVGMLAVLFGNMNI